ncbi:PepSY-associated TM helix domain-containing protein [Bacteroides sp. 519]|uniref:PepSY-associated TM helix domain-containing protein n=1 Tax=Bacteroides sp. 519 TaxID=2302937 RepID=UPI0013D132DD|nr:PepSY-associated TM helix domain-containing protein [Bacteroides sp. 519]NDV60728.1 PepSY domain-containing protein [Bacteroides sp. 519]
MKKLHKVTGIVLALIIIWMGVSGVILNHRKSLSEKGISRKHLPASYQYNNWNYGFFKGSLTLSPDTVFLYGSEGIWLTNEMGDSIVEYNQGIRSGADNLKISRMIQAPGSEVYAAGMYQLYRYNPDRGVWENQQLPADIDRITDLEIKGDTLVVLTRSELLVAKVSHNLDFEKIELAASPDRDNKRSLFRIIWKLHSGELFGTLGQVVVDFFAVLLAFFSITGLIIWLLPKRIKARKKKKQLVQKHVKTFRFSWKWHNSLGYWFTIPLLILVISGTFLRPPLLIAIAKSEVTPPPLTTMSTDNAWHDQLRVIRYDSLQHEWLLYTSDGFYTLPDFAALPRKIKIQPPVSVMGVNVLQQLDEVCWVVGSFSGLTIWNRSTGTSIDGFTGEPVRPISGMPFGQRKISGFTTALKNRTVVFDYDRGAYVFEQDRYFTPMPNKYANRPMSLWNLALEMHTGRIFTFLGMWNVLFVFVVGIAATSMIVSGWWVYRKKR